jgi:GNAT superfamily N-acetyltransferase
MQDGTIAAIGAVGAIAVAATLGRRGAPQGGRNKSGLKTQGAATLRKLRLPEDVEVDLYADFADYTWGPASWSLSEEPGHGLRLENVYVKPSSRGEGLAGELMELVTSEADRLQIPLTLRVDAEPLEYEDDDGEWIEETQEEADDRVAGLYLQWGFHFVDPVSRQMLREPKAAR